MERRSGGRDPWAWAGLACVLAFVGLTMLVVRQGELAIDAPIAAAIRSLPLPTAVWQAVTDLGGSVLAAVGAALVLAAALSGRLRLALIVGVVLIAAHLFADLAKDLVARPRPPDPLVPASGWSFPSGHALRSTAAYGLLALVAWRARLPPGIHGAAVVIGVTLPLCIGLSRVALGVHWPSDVLAGWLAGTAFVALAATLIRVTRAMDRDLPAGTAAVSSPDVPGR